MEPTTTWAMRAGASCSCCGRMVTSRHEVSGLILCAFCYNKYIEEALCENENEEN